MVTKQRESMADGAEGWCRAEIDVRCSPRRSPLYQCETPLMGAFNNPPALASPRRASGGAFGGECSWVTKLTTTVVELASCRLICSGTKSGAVHVWNSMAAVPVRHGQIGP